MMLATARGRFSVDRRGAGAPLVLMHSLAMAGAMWDCAMDRLAGAGVESIVYDARGHGDTEWDGKPFSIEDMADDVLAVLDSLRIQRAHLLGLSLGGSTAIVFAAKHPERVGRLVLADTTAWYGPTREKDWAERAENALEPDREALLSFQMERWFSPGFRSENAAETERIGKIFVSNDPQGHAQACRALGGLEARPLLSNIEADTLVIVGEDDYATPPQMARTLVDGIAGARLEILPGIRHMSLVEQLDVWDQVLAHIDR